MSPHGVRVRADLQFMCAPNRTAMKPGYVEVQLKKFLTAPNILNTPLSQNP